MLVEWQPSNRPATTVGVPRIQSQKYQCFQEPLQRNQPMCRWQTISTQPLPQVLWGAGPGLAATVRAAGRHVGLLQPYWMPVD